MSVTVILAACLLGTIGDVESAPDVVELKNGRSLEGRVIFEDEEKLVLLVKTREKEIEQEDITSVRAVRRELPGALDEIAALPRGDVAAHHALASSLEDRNLPREARLVYWKVLTFQSDDALANERLGNRLRRKSWTIPHKGRWYRMKDRAKLLERWKGAWEFESTHYRVRTNLPLATAVDAVLDLERGYRGFYQIFGQGLELWEVTETMEAWIHADASSFPESGDGGRSYFSPGDGRLYVNASGGFPLSTVIHEATHALLYFSAVHTRSGRGDIPGWLDEGLAEYMRASRTGEAGAIAFQPGKPNDAHFAEHGGEKDPYRLNRVLNMQSGDFLGTTKTALKYAQAYTLVHFCLHGDGGSHRPGFLAFMRSAYEGKSSSTHFKKVIGMKEKALEKAWHAYAAIGGRR